MKNIRQVISGGLDSAPSPCFSSLIPDNVPAVQFRNAEYKPGWKMCVYIYVRYVLTGREREQGSKEVWRKKRRDYGKYFDFHEKLIERTARFK